MHETIEINIGKLTFDCRVAGDSINELVILLHGFPETSIMWVKLMNKLSLQGYYCIAPDMRGYSSKACPKGIANYTSGKLSQDIVNIADSLGRNKFHLIGHDWGAAIGWYVAHTYSNRIISWAGLSVPHPRAFGAAYKLNKEQRKKSRYIKWFLIPALPEILIRRNDFALFRLLWQRSSPEELENYLTVFKRRQCLTGALNYYRANIGKGKGENIGDIKTPTLFVWGNKDVAIGAFAAEGNHKYMKGDYTFLEVAGGHWLIQTNYSEIETAIIEHVSKYKTAPKRV